MKKIFRKLHLWLSIPFGLIITVICFTGAMLVFENEVMELTYPQRYYVEKSGESPLPLDVLLARVSAELPDSVEVNSVNISSNPDKAYQMSLSKPRRASVYVDQYTGEIKWRYERSAFFTTMFRLHRWLMDSANPDGGVFVGKLLVGISTIMFVVALITGIVIWWPRTRKALKNSLKISVRKGLKRFWYDLHIAGGMYALVLLLAMALTGLTWSFPWYRNGFYAVFGVEQQQSHGAQPAAQNAQPTQAPAAHGATTAEAGEGRPARDGEASANRERDGRSQTDGEQPSARGDQGDEREGRPEARGQNGGRSPKANAFAHWQGVYETIRGLNPDHKQISVSKSSASVSFSRWGNQRASDKYTYDPASGEITEVSLYKDQEKASKMRGWIYTVHVGAWGGLFSRILTVLAALLGASLPLTGYYLWIKKLINKSKARKNRRAV